MPCKNCQKKKITAQASAKTFKTNVNSLIENIKKQRVKEKPNGTTKEN
jgi:hypothetical protein